MVEHKDILAIVQVLRNTTRIVKLYPFVVTIAYIITIIGYMFCSDNVATFLDQALYTSPLVVLFNIMLSYSLKLCKWHRLECSLPIYPLIPLIIDKCIHPIGKIGAIVNCITILVLIIASLINAYFVFVKPKQ